MSLSEAGMAITPEQIIVEIPLDALCLILEMNHLEMPIFRRQKGVDFSIDIETDSYPQASPYHRIPFPILRLK
jgi:hypothetical protein